MRGPRAHILVIEDDRDLRESVMEALEGQGYSVDAASDGVRALAYLARAARKPDLILLDLAMPNMGGFTFREEQLKRAEHASIPVAILTADADIKDKAKALHAAGFVRKPLRLKALFDLVSRILNEAEASEPAGANAKDASAASSKGLADGGEMGALVRAMDWSKTPLGRIEQWPEVLRAAVSTCLGSRFPIAIGWGKDLVQIYNDAFRALLGHKHPRALGQEARACWPELAPRFGPALEDVLAEGHATWSENELLALERHGFSEESYFTSSFSPIRDASGRIVGVHAAVMETTRQVLAERRSNTLRELAKRTALARTPEDACQIAAGVLAENAADLPFTRIHLLEGDGDDESLRLAGTAGAGNGGLPIATDVPIRLPDGRPCGLLTAAISPRLELDEAYQDFLERVADHIGAAIAHSHALRVAHEWQLERAVSFSDTFVNRLAHELRNPLSGILAAAVLIEGRAESDRIAIPVRRIATSADRMDRMIGQLLDFTRVRLGRGIPIAHHELDLAALARSVVGEMHPDPRTGIRVHDEGDARGVWDEDRLGQLLGTLVQNAREHGVRATPVDVHIDGKDPACVTLAVENRGALLPELMDHVFEPLKLDGQKREGTSALGLGLFIAREIALAHAGTLRVETTPDTTRFIVTLPRAPRVRDSMP